MVVRHPKIIHYNPRFLPLIGGGEIYLKNIVDSLVGYDYEIVTNAIVGEPLSESNDDNIQITRFLPNDRSLVPYNNGFISKISLPYRLLCDIIRIKNQLDYIRKSQFDIFQVHGIGFIGKFFRVDHYLGRLFFSKLLRFDVIKKPKILTVHNLFSRILDSQVARDYEKYIFQQFDNIICVDKHIETHIKNMFADSDSEKKIWYIPNSVDSNLFKYLPINPHVKTRLGFIGRLDSSRGYKYLIRLINKLPENLDLHIVGAGNEHTMNEMRQLVQFRKNMYLYENLPNQKLIEIFQNIDILFNPVIVEGISRITLESMSCGRPVIMLNIGDRAPIKNGINGFIINNEEELLDLLTNIQSYDLNTISINARNSIIEEYTNDLVNSKLQQVYKNML